MTVYFAADATSSFIQFSCLVPGVDTMSEVASMQEDQTFQQVLMY
jgi:hypothetical protein